jgi:hypothetical protein
VKESLHAQQEAIKGFSGQILTFTSRFEMHLRDLKQVAMAPESHLSLGQPKILRNFKLKSCVVLEELS